MEALFEQEKWEKNERKHVMEGTLKAQEKAVLETVMVMVRVAKNSYERKK